MLRALRTIGYLKHLASWRIQSRRGAEEERPQKTFVLEGELDVAKIGYWEEFALPLG